MEEQNSLITRLLEKKYNVDDIYVGLVGRQYEKRATTKNEIIEDFIALSFGNVNYRWECKLVDQPVCFFIKTLGGYKRITTGKKYKVATKDTMGEVLY